MQGTECVTVCTVGYYPNDATRMCDKCIANCFICANSLSCIQCKPGYLPIDGECKDSLGCTFGQVQYKNECLDRCPIGTYKSGDTCIRACPTSPAITYFYNLLCYPTCPTGHHTPEACVASCAGLPNCV